MVIEPFIEETIPAPPSVLLVSLFIYGISILFHCSMCLFECQYHTLLIPQFCNIQGRVKVSLQFEYEKLSLFLHYDLLLIVLFSKMNNCKATFALPCSLKSGSVMYPPLLFLLAQNCLAIMAFYVA